MELITLIENKTSVNHLKCEHGLSFYLKFKDVIILFDLGQSGKFIANAEQLGIDLTKVDYVVLSHGHYDHTGGLPAFFEINIKAKVYLHREALKERFSWSTQMIKPNHIAWRDDVALYSNRFIFVDEPLELVPGLWLLTNIGKSKGMRLTNKKLIVRKNNVNECDQFEDEIVIVAKDKDLPVVLNGCAHHGIINILNEVKAQLGFDHYQLIAGGLHLNGQSEETIQKVIDELKPFSVEKWAINHCTGEKAVEVFINAFPNRVEYCHTGIKHELD
ncbi:MBL fold metallo-hydrolase [Carboxylicivirga sp. N1Y90]|uniref:MBL fold metallo-hydrolase n=1 Tax=Carboxylicivirga fragile TaxID=3417571 RepID=UPI003D325DB1|nr:MBL fold metallo-hydrolase [Marinilabiliaceae bacterium N1Y90]